MANNGTLGCAQGFTNNDFVSTASTCSGIAQFPCASLCLLTPLVSQHTTFY